METKTETKKAEGLEPTANAWQGHPLALVAPAGSTGYAPFKAPAMTNERKEFLKRQFTPTGCTDLEFEFFLAYCERTGLDPVIKQAYLIERKQKVFKDGRDVWVSKFEPMSAEAGMAARADAMPDFEGIDDGVVYEGDEFSIDYAEGIVIHRSNPLKRGRIIGAWAHVHRRGRRVPITWLRVEERIQTKNDGGANFFWSKMTATQILKCSRAEQWRQAYPNLFAGEFVPEEMDRDEVDVTPPNAEEAKRPTADKLADKIKPTAQATPPAKQPAPGGVTIDVERPPAKQPDATPQDPARAAMTKAAVKLAGGITNSEIDRAGPPPVEEPKGNVVPLTTATARAEAKLDPSKVTVFGDNPGREIAKLEGPEMLQLIALGESKFPGIKNAARKAEVRSCIDAMVRERQRREDALLAEPDAAPPAKAREPGEDDGEEF